MCKSVLFFLGLVLFVSGAVSRLSAQTNVSPAKLAIISEGNAANAAVDLLTVEFSSRTQIQILERTQIEKIYHEQALTSGSKDVIKLGQVLGADGLLVLSPVVEGTNNFMQVRLVAVRPGVVIAAVRAAWPVQEVSAWVHWLANHFDPLLQKLSVPVRDAIPISVVNLRSATRSTEAQETDRQLTALVTERLTRERELFVLERRRMDLLTAEKELQGMGESAFWNGSYLLEGTIDRDGYAKETVTVNARLIPPRNGRPIEISLQGPRGNPGQVMERLVVQILSAMQKQGSAEAWQPEAEAANYLEEAKWALKWNMIPEAQAAADAAWALGKRDLASALLRGRAHVAGVLANLARYEFTGTTFSPGYNADGEPANPPPKETRIQADINSKLAKHPLGGAYKRGPRSRDGTITIEFALFASQASPENIAQAKQTLESYLEFSQNSPEGQPQILTRGKGWNDWRNSDWYQLGIEELAAASAVLQNFYFVPQSDPAVVSSLAELRALVRVVAKIIADSPSVRESYFVGARIATHDELAHTLAERPNIFSCMTEWGCFWQETPEDALALYRKLMESPTFCYIHKGFWKRSPIHPRLVAWNKKDRQRLPQLWDNFMRELNGSPNPLWQMEAKALARADAVNEEALKMAEQEWWGVVRSNRAALVANNVELFYLGWNFISNAETEAMTREYWDKTVPAVKVTAAFEEQKKFLRENQPYDLKKFAELFREKSYTKAQAQEILPLIAAYQSNLLALAEQADLPQKRRLQNNARSVDFFLGRTVDKILNPPAAAPPPATSTTVVAPPAQPRPAKRLESPAESSEPITNILIVKKFLEIPLRGLSEDTITTISVTSHHLQGDKLVLDLQLGRAIYSGDVQGNWRSTSYAKINAVAILDLPSERWQVIEVAKTGVADENQYYYHTALWRGSVFTSQGGKVTRYDSATKTSVELDLPGIGNCGLFVVGDRLFGVTRELIIELVDRGASMRILASNRRRPPVSALDTESFGGSGFVLGTPAFFSDAGGNLRVVTANKIFSWQGPDWQEIAAAPPVARPPWIAEDHVLFFGDGWNTPAGIWRFPADGTNAEYCLGQERPMDRFSRARPANAAKPIWELPPGLTLAQLPAASRGNDLFLLVDHAKAQNIVNEREHVITGTRILLQDGYHAALLCFTRNYAAPQQVYLKFDDAGGVLPVSGNPNGNGRMPSEAPESWLYFAAGRLYLGRESFRVYNAGERSGALPKIGVWVTSLESIDAEIARQKQVQTAQAEQQVDANRHGQQELLNKYDGNHDGVITGTEKSLALADKNFVASQLEQIDTNHNDFLNASELKYFDANTNNTLEAGESAGIDHAQQLFAERWFRRVDSNRDGLLDRREFEELGRAIYDPTRNAPIMPSFPDTNHDNSIDVEEMEAFCREQTQFGLMSNRPPWNRRPFPGPPGVSPRGAAGQNFPTLVEEFWREGSVNQVRPAPRPNQPTPAAAPLNMPK